MQTVRCPKCREDIILNEAQINLLRANGRVLCSCSACKHIFDHTHKERYKRPLKFTVLSALGKGTPLKNGDAVLNHPDHHYHAAGHFVSKRVIISGGAQGAVEFTIPRKIKTHEELSAYLDAEAAKQGCAQCGAPDETQADDAFVSLSELTPCEENHPTGYRHYRYMDMFLSLSGDDRLSYVITGDTGYQPMLLYRDHLTEELGFKQENDYGLTDMVQEYSYKGFRFVLDFCADADTISFDVYMKDEKVPKCFFETALLLDRIDVSKFKS